MFDNIIDFITGLNIQSKYIITPIMGAIIGYFTNWLAIKMLFRPYEEKRIFGIKVPFTPGLIPKERYALSKKVGDTISKHLLTEEVMTNALISNEIHTSIESILDKGINYLKNDERTLNDVVVMLSEQIQDKDNLSTSNRLNIEDRLTDMIINKLREEEMQDKIADLVFAGVDKLLKAKVSDLPTDKIKGWLESVITQYGVEFVASEKFDEIIEKNVSGWISGLYANEKKIGEIFSDPAKQIISSTVQEKVGPIAKGILTVIEKPEVESKLREFIIQIIEQNVNKLVTIFVSPTNIYNSIISGIKNYLLDENNYVVVAEKVLNFTDEVYKMNINEVIEKLPEEYKEYPLADLAVQLSRKLCTKENVYSVISMMSESVDKIREKNLYDFIISIEPNIDSKIKLFIKDTIKNGTNDEKLRLNIYSFIKTQLDRIKSKPIKDLFKNISDEFMGKVKKIGLTLYDLVVKKAMLNMLKAINISKIVEDRINDFDMGYAESILFNVVNKELKEITILGGILGFVIGIVTVFL